MEAAKARILQLIRMRREIDEECTELSLRVARASAKWKVGQRVRYLDRGEYEISDIGIYWTGAAKYFGRRVLKSGKLCARKIELWSRDSITGVKP